MVAEWSDVINKRSETVGFGRAGTVRQYLP
jgi:hypothetical protein